MDFVGYGSADCREGSATSAGAAATPRRSSASAAARPTPTAMAATSLRARRRRAAPRRSSNSVRCVLTHRSAANGINVPRDATIVRSRSPSRSTSSARGSTSRAPATGAAQQRHAGRRRAASLHHAERGLPRRRSLHGDDLQGSDSRSGRRRCGAEHRHAAGELHVVVHRRHRHAAAVSAERAPGDGQSDECDGRHRISRTTT